MEPNFNNAWEAAHAIKPIRDLARESDVTPDEKKVLDGLAERREAKLMGGTAAVSSEKTEKKDDSSLEEAPSFFAGMVEGSDGRGYFPGYAISKGYRDGVHLFNFYSKNENEAEFNFISNEHTIKFVKNTYVENMKPACIILNLPTTKTARVETVSPGKVVLDRHNSDGNWKVVEQAKIRFVDGE